MDQHEENTDEATSKYTNETIMAEDYVKNRDRREAKNGKRLFHAFLFCVLIGIAIVTVYALME